MGGISVLVLVSLALGVISALDQPDNLHPQVELLEQGAGVVFQTGPKAVFTASSWLLTYHVSIRGYVESLQLLQDMYLKEQDIVRNMSRTHEVYNTSNIVISKALRATESRMSQLVNFIEGNYHLQHIQEKRSIPLLSSVGEIANALFGVATETDIEYLEQQITQILKRDSMVESIQEKQVTVFRAMEGRIQDLERQMSEESNITSQLLTTIYRMFGDPEKGAGEDGRGQSLLHLVWQNDFLQNTNLLREAIDQMSMAVTRLLEGYISPELLDANSLSTALQHVQRKIPPHLRLAIDHDNRQRLQQYYTIPVARHIPSKEGIRGVLRLPLINTGQQYTIYKAIPFPQQTPNDPRH